MSNFTQIQPSIPPCSLPWLSTTLSTTPSFLSDPSTCTDTTLQTPLWDCLQRSCDFPQQAQYYNLIKPFCTSQPVPSRSLAAMIEPAILGPVTLLAIATRLYSRYTISKCFGADDYLIFAAGLLYSGTIFLYIFNTTLGFGKHTWNIEPSNTRILSLIFYIGELSYLTCITLIRLSILFFYLRIFMKRRFRVTVWIIIAFVGASGIAFLVAALFQCVPITGVFNHYVPSKCLSLNALAFSNAGIGIASDIIILFLPFPEVIHLTMITRKKIILILMFLLGSFACLTSIIRVRYLKAFAASTDETVRDNQPGSLWSFAEQSVAIICACMPAIRKLLSKYLPNILDMGGVSPQYDDPFKHVGAAPNMDLQDRPRSLYAISVFSIERPKKTIFTGDEGPGSPFRCSFDISAESDALL